MGKGNRQTKGKFIKAIYSGPATALFAVFAGLSALIFLAARNMYVFINAGTFSGFAEAVLALILVNAATSVTLSFIRAAGKDIFKHKAVRILYIVSATLTAVSVIVCITVLAISEFYIFPYYIGQILPGLLTLLGALFLIFVFPRVKNGRAYVAAGIIAVIAIPMLLSGAGLFTLRLIAEPFVMDTGSCYRIIWATSGRSVGWVEYTFEGKEYRVFDSAWGKKASEKVHAVDIPYEHLKSNSYKVYSQKVILELAYGGYRGKTISSKTYNFKGEAREDTVIWSLSDWHSDGDLAYAATRHMEKPDVVILLGDHVNAMYREGDIARHIIAPAAKISGGEVPVIFARGNHDTRGVFARKLGYSFKIDTFYTDITMGDNRFIVLDTGEDKEDSHKEYGGMADFDAHRANQGEWLMGLNKGTEKRLIVVAHDHKLSINKEQADTWREKLIELGADFMLSGHQHKTKIIEGDILTVIDGGKLTQDGVKTGTYVGTEIIISGETLKITSYDTNGKIYINETRGIG